MKRLLVFSVGLLMSSCGDGGAGVPDRFDPETDLLSLHYDHAPDKDDGHSAAADRTVLASLFGREWLLDHAVAVSGAYGTNAAEFNDSSDAVMDVAFGDVGGWLDAHEDRDGVVAALASRWRATLEAGGDVWVKEGGQSDLTWAVLERLQGADASPPPRQHVHVVQHSDWNEDHTAPEALRLTREATDYIRIPDANAYLNVPGGDEAFQAAATSHPAFGGVWRAAFAYYDPAVRLDFSDTGELLYIVGLDTMSIDVFRTRFLTAGRER